MRQGPRAFEATFSAATVLAGTVRNALTRAYDSACESHLPSRGSNEMTFGFNVYHFAVHELTIAAERSGGALRVMSLRPVFRLGANDYELACHRVGTHADQNIDTAFPNNDNAACTMVQAQLWLPGIDRSAGIEQARKVVIAHLGNPDDGLGAIYACIPGRTVGDRITGWAWTHRIWHLEDGRSAEVVAPASPPPAEVIEAPVVRRKRKRADKSEEEG